MQVVSGSFPPAHLRSLCCRVYQRLLPLWSDCQRSLKIGQSLAHPAQKTECSALCLPGLNIIGMVVNRAFEQRQSQPGKLLRRRPLKSLVVGETNQGDTQVPVLLLGVSIQIGSPEKGERHSRVRPETSMFRGRS